MPASLKNWIHSEVAGGWTGLVIPIIPSREEQPQNHKSSGSHILNAHCTPGPGQAFPCEQLAALGLPPSAKEETEAMKAMCFCLTLLVTALPWAVRPHDHLHTWPMPKFRELGL